MTRPSMEAVLRLARTGGILMVLLSPTPLVAASPGDSPRLGEGSTPEARIASFLDQFSTVESVHIEAHALIHLQTPAGAVTGQGSFLYQEQDGRFRIRCQTDRHLGLMDDVEYSYDGKRSLIWFLPSNTVTSNESFLERTPTALPNPFFLPLDLVLDSRGCSECRWSLERLRDWREDAPLGALRFEGSESSVHGRNEQPSSRVALTRVADRWVPGRVVRTMPEQAGEIVLTMRDYEVLQEFVFPRAMTVETLDPQQRAAMRMELLITNLEINRPISPDSFSTIGDEKSTFILSGDPTKDIDLP